MTLHMFSASGPDSASWGAMHTSSNDRRRGFSMIELLVVISLVGLIGLMAFSKTSQMMTQWRVSRAAQAYSEELQSAFAIVGRNRTPVMIVLDTARMELRMHDRAGVVYRRRNFGPTSAYKLDKVNLFRSRDSVEVFPPGLAADSMTVTIIRNGKFRRIRLLRGGLVQVCSNPSTLNGPCTPA